MTPLTLDSKLKLNDGTLIPHIGLGVYEMTEDETYTSVKYALEIGYRLIDTAAWYENEEPCCRAIRDFCRESSTPRAQVYYVTKLQYNEGTEATRRKIANSLSIVKANDLEYIDLYLVHGPPGGPRLRKESWDEVVRAHQAGDGLKSIGVSNFGLRHMEEMRTAWGTADESILTDEMAWAGVKPSINQIDVHPFMTRDDIDAYAKKHNITLQAWAPLVRALRFDHPEIERIAKTHGKEPAQILLRYSLQHGYIPIPKSVSRKRIQSNIDLFDFDLTDEEMVTLHSLNENLLTDWDVTECP